MKTKICSILLGVALMLFVAATSNAAPVVTIFAGSSGAFESFGVASDISTVCGGATNFWSQGNTANNGIIDGNSSPIEQGSWFAAWDGLADGSTAAHVCAYFSVDSVVGVRLFFSTGPASLRSKVSLGGTFASGNKIPQIPDTVATLPAAIVADLNGQVISAGVSDIRPEDAQFASNRTKNSLGWGTNPVCSAFTHTSAQVIQFAISGTDPLSGSTVPTYETINIGAYPVMFFYNKTATVNTTDLGSLLPTDINSHNIAGIWGGLTGQTTDLGHFAPGTYNIGGGPAPGGQPLYVLVREPISGTYNTVNFQAVHNAGTSQDQETIFPAPTATNCTTTTFPPANPSGNPSYKVTGAGTTYARGIGTGEVVTQTKTRANAIGYGFWSFSTYAGTTSQLNYLTVDGVDPLQAAPTGGAFPQCAAGVCPVLPLTHVADGSYRVWNIIRVITSPGNTNVEQFVKDAQNQTVAPTVHPVTDFVPFVANGKQWLSVFRSHYTAPNLVSGSGPITAVCGATNINEPVNGPVPAGLVGCPEGGGDMAGAVFTWAADIDSYLAGNNEFLGYLQ